LILRLSAKTDQDANFDTECKTKMPILTPCVRLSVKNDQYAEFESKCKTNQRVNFDWVLANWLTYWFFWFSYQLIVQNGHF